MVLFITSINLTLAGAIEYSDIAGLPGVMWQQIGMACISPLLAIALSWHSRLPPTLTEKSILTVPNP